MKKLLLTVLVIPFLICFNGCTSQKEPPLIDLDFEANANIEYNGNTFTAKILNEEREQTVITLNTPQELEGLTYTYKGSSLAIEYNKLKCETKDGYLPNRSMAQMIHTLIETLSDEENYSFEKFEKEDAVFSCKSGESTFKIITDEDGIIKDIKSQDGLLHIILATAE